MAIVPGMTKDKPQAFDQTHEKLSGEKALVLFNDEINSFDFVIESLIKICNHAPEQAEQCALIAHFNGKCVIKTGKFVELKPPHDELSKRGLTVSVY